MIPWGSCVLWLGYPLQNGVWPDVSKHDNDGAIIGARWDQAAIEFDGVDDYVNCGYNNTFSFTDELTIVAVVKPFELVLEEFIISKYQTSGDMRCFALIIDNASFGFRVSPDGTFGNSKTLMHYETTLTQWCHVVATFKDTIMRIYVNGVEHTSTETISTIYNSATNVNIGRFIAWGYFEGKMSILRLHNIALTAQQIKEDYEQCYRII